MKKKYTRKELIEICEQAIVLEKDWSDRDSEQSQRNVGVCWAFLKCGCDFEIVYDDGLCSTDDRTIWLWIYTKGFECFEGGGKERYHIYLPTKKRLKECEGGDWY